MLRASMMFLQLQVVLQKKVAKSAKSPAPKHRQTCSSALSILLSRRYVRGSNLIFRTRKGSQAAILQYNTSTVVTQILPCSSRSADTDGFCLTSNHDHKVADIQVTAAGSLKYQSYRVYALALAKEQPEFLTKQGVLSVTVQAMQH